MTPTEIAAALFQAFEAGDTAAARRLCSPDLIAVQNMQRRMTFDELLEFSTAVLSAVSSFRYVDAARTETEDGFVEEHGVEIVLRDGRRIQFAACVVGVVRCGQVVELREIVDGAGAAPLLMALSGAGAAG